MTKKGKPVVLRMHGQWRGKVYPSIVALCKENGKEKIGIELQALWNALSKSKGRFSNRYCTITYAVFDIEPKEWK